MNWSLYLNIESVGKRIQLVKKEFKERNREVCLKTTVYQGLSAENICIYMAASGSCSSPCCLQNLIWSSVREQH